MIKDGKIQNISLWDGDVNRWQPPTDMTVIPAPDHVGIGWGYDGENWTPPVIVEEVLTEPPAEEEPSIT